MPLPLVLTLLQRTVVYADIEQGPARDTFVDLCTDIRKLLSAHQVPMVTSYEFIPHLTLLKLSNCWLLMLCCPDTPGKKSCIKRFPDKFYYELSQLTFGTEVRSSRLLLADLPQTLESIDLCELKVCNRDSITV
jgi:hypothetical protein